MTTPDPALEAAARPNPNSSKDIQESGQLERALNSLELTDEAVEAGAKALAARGGDEEMFTAEGRVRFAPMVEDYLNDSRAILEAALPYLEGTSNLEMRLAAEEHAHRRDNEYLVGENARLRAALDALTGDAGKQAAHDWIDTTVSAPSQHLAHSLVDGILAAAWDALLAEQGE